MQRVKCFICGQKKNKVLFELKKSQQGETFQIGECFVCGHVFMDPRPTTKELVKYYAQDYHYDGDFYNEVFAKQALGFYNEIKSYLKPKSTIIDIGCSKGYLLNFAKRAGHKVRGIEISSDAAIYVKKNFDIDVLVGPVEKQKIKAKSVDVITAFDLIEHLPNPKKTISQMFEWLKPGGQMIIDTPNFDSIYRKISQDRWVGFDMPFHIHLFRKETLVRVLKEIGFSEVVVETSHFNLFSREGFVRSKAYGLLVLAVKFLRLSNMWERAQKHYLVQPVAHENMKMNKSDEPAKESGYRDPKISFIDILEAGINAPFNYYFGKKLLWGDGLRVIAKKPI